MVEEERINIMSQWSPTACHRDGLSIPHAAQEPLLGAEQRGPPCLANGSLEFIHAAGPGHSFEQLFCPLCSLVHFWFVSGLWYETCCFCRLNIPVQDNLRHSLVVSENKRGF